MLLSRSDDAAATSSDEEKAHQCLSVRVKNDVAGEASSSSTPARLEILMRRHEHGILVEDHYPFYRIFSIEEMFLVDTWQEMDDAQSIVAMVNNHKEEKEECDDDEGRCGLILYQNIQVASYPSMCIVHYLFVMESYRRHGVGSALLEALPTKHLAVLGIDAEHFPFWTQNGFEITTLGASQAESIYCAFKGTETIDLFCSVQA